MLKPLTMSLSLAVALGVCSASMAGAGLCGIASPQGPCPSPQGPCPSPQGAYPSPQGCGLSGLCGGGGGRKIPSLFSYFNKPKCYTYEWVLKKKRVWGCGGAPSAPTTCATPVYPSGQACASAQAYGGGPSYIPTTYGSGQWGTGPAVGPAAPVMPAPTPAPAPAPSGDEA
ncbi:MAG: hypothetical protein JO329_12205, partial [Planctomycetaceae bacterium]|nr:hypothetical protein [Planctomycetaceae bacterium]